MELPKSPPSPTSPSDFSCSNFTPEELHHFRQHARRVNRALGAVHEGVGPQLTSSERLRFGGGEDYGGVTGTITPGSFARVVEVMCRFPHHPLNRTSVFCDIGSGTGRPTLSVTGLPVRASLGFDVSPLQVFSSCAGWAKVEAQAPMAPTALLRHDAQLLASLDPVTHAYAFVGYGQMVHIITQLVVRSTQLKVLALVVLREQELHECRLIDAEDTDHIRLTGLKMPSGLSYLGYVVPITPERRARLQAGKLVEGDSLHHALEEATTAEGRATLRARGLDGLSRKRRAVCAPLG